MERTCKDCKTTFSFTKNQIKKKLLFKKGYSNTTTGSWVDTSITDPLFKRKKKKIHILKVRYKAKENLYLKTIKCPACERLQKLEDHCEPFLSQLFGGNYDLHIDNAYWYKQTERTVR